MARDVLVDSSPGLCLARLDLGLVETLARIAILTEDNALPDSEKVQRIRTITVLSCQYGITNANIREGKNPYIKIKSTGFGADSPIG
jgi:hypothetical protein